MLNPEKSEAAHDILDSDLTDNEYCDIEDLRNEGIDIPELRHEE